MNKRIFKQISYLSFFLLFFLILSYVLYLFFKATPTCFDGEKNQGEEGVDCGGPCSRVCLPENFKDIQVSSVKFLNIGNKTILLAKIQNPNSSIAAWQFNYEFVVLGVDGSVLKKVVGQSFIYAEEIKYLSQILNENLSNINQVELKIYNPLWVKSEYFLRPKINLLTKEILLQNGVVYLRGKIINNDFVNFENVKILVNFYKQNELIGYSETTINQIKPSETLPFEVLFPQNLDLSNIQTEILIESKRT